MKIYDIFRNHLQQYLRDKHKIDRERERKRRHRHRYNFKRKKERKKETQHHKKIHKKAGWDGNDLNNTAKTLD